MKKTLFLIFLGLVTLSSCNNNGTSEVKQDDESQTISLSFSGAFALYPLVQQWAEAYNKVHPEIRFEIQAGGAGKGLTDCLAGAVDVGMFSRELKEEEKAKGVWWIALCKDAVIPTMNAKNPSIDAIKARGLTKQEFKGIFTDSLKTWGSIIPANTSKINVYTRADAAGAADAWASFFGKKQDDLKGIGVNGDPGVADAVRKDKNSIGYNNTLFVFDPSTGNKLGGIDVVPIDVNGDGKIDDSENFYQDLPTFLKAVNDGRFPSPPARNLYFLTKGKTQKKELLDFFKWVLTDGQKLVATAGYVQLPAELINQQLEKLK